MSRRTRLASLRVGRFTLNYAADDLPWEPGYLEAIADTLANGLDIEFRFGRSDVWPWFRLRTFCGAIHILGADFRHLATMASIPAAVAMGWQAVAERASLITAREQP